MPLAPKGLPFPFPFPFPFPLLGVALAVAILEDSVVDVELVLYRIWVKEGSGVS